MSCRYCGGDSCGSSGGGPAMCENGGPAYKTEERIPTRDPKWHEHLRGEARAREDARLAALALRVDAMYAKGKQDMPPLVVVVDEEDRPRGRPKGWAFPPGHKCARVRPK